MPGIICRGAMGAAACGLPAPPARMESSVGTMYGFKVLRRATDDLCDVRSLSRSVIDNVVGTQLTVCRTADR